LRPAHVFAEPSADGALKVVAPLQGPWRFALRLGISHHVPGDPGPASARAGQLAPWLPPGYWQKLRKAALALAGFAGTLGPRRPLPRL